MREAILGISAFYHDSAAAIIVDGKLIAAAQEERFTRKKFDSGFPANAVKYILDEAGLELSEISAVAFYDKPYVKFERLLETFHEIAPRGLKSFAAAMPVWIKEKLFMKDMLKKELKKLGDTVPKLLFPEHHLSHAASAFYPSPFEEAAILTLDGVGEWATTTIGHGKKNEISILKELTFPHSLGLLYSAFTYYCGFRVNSGEYKLMGLAPYGNNKSPNIKKWKDAILSEMVDLKDDGSFLLNMKYFNYLNELTMTNDSMWLKLFGLPRREAEGKLTQDYMDMALAIQQLTEEIILKLAKTTKELTKCKYLVMAGGVALNCVANGKLLRANIFEDIWIQPAAGDAGGAVGAAYSAWYTWLGKTRKVEKPDSMGGAYLGPEYSDIDIAKVVTKYEAISTHYESFDTLCVDVVKHLEQGKVVGWFQGRMEFGPRALGNRTILGDPRHPEMQKKLNLKIKYREGFRPFAPSVLEEEVSTYFDIDRPSPYMLLVADVKKERHKKLPDNYESLPLYERLYFLRSDMPAITHIDFSARLHSVNKNVNYKYWKLINTFKEKTGYGVIVNTSYNIRGEPIVCTPENAYVCFMKTEMDYLVVGNFMFEKTVQPKLSEKRSASYKFDLD